MHKALELIKSKYCSICQLGTPSKLIGYKSTGTCLDYIYDTYKVPYSLAMEIYSNEVNFPDLDFIRTTFKNLRGAATDAVKNEVSKFYDMEYMKKYNSNMNEQCLRLFNPVDKVSYDFIINNWTMVYIVNFRHYLS
jgi:hypothetical protein